MKWVGLWLQTLLTLGLPAAGCRCPLLHNIRGRSVLIVLVAGLCPHWHTRHSTFRADPWEPCASRPSPHLLHAQIVRSHAPYSLRRAVERARPTTARRHVQNLRHGSLPHWSAN